MNKPIDGLRCQFCEAKTGRLPDHYSGWPRKKLVKSEWFRAYFQCDKNPNLSGERACTILDQALCLEVSETNATK